MQLFFPKTTTPPSNPKTTLSQNPSTDQSKRGDAAQTSRNGRIKNILLISMPFLVGGASYALYRFLPSHKEETSTSKILSRLSEVWAPSKQAENQTKNYLLAGGASLTLITLLGLLWRHSRQPSDVPEVNSTLPPLTTNADALHKSSVVTQPANNLTAELKTDKPLPTPPINDYESLLKTYGKLSIQQKKKGMQEFFYRDFLEFKLLEKQEKPSKEEYAAARQIAATIVEMEKIDTDKHLQSTLSGALPLAFDAFLEACQMFEQSKLLTAFKEFGKDKTEKGFEEFVAELNDLKSTFRRMVKIFWIMFEKENKNKSDPTTIAEQLAGHFAPLLSKKEDVSDVKNALQELIQNQGLYLKSLKKKVVKDLVSTGKKLVHFGKEILTSGKTAIVGVLENIEKAMKDVGKMKPKQRAEWMEKTVDELIDIIEKNNKSFYQSEGIFRQARAADTDLVNKKITIKGEAPTQVLENFDATKGNGAHDLAGIFKNFIRVCDLLSNPGICSLYTTAASDSNQVDADFLTTLFATLDENSDLNRAKRYVFGRFLEVMRKTIEGQKKLTKNKMDAKNLAIVFAPSLGEFGLNIQKAITILNYMITNQDKFDQCFKNEGSSRNPQINMELTLKEDS